MHTANVIILNSSTYSFNLNSFFNPNIGHFFKHANLLEINLILPSKTGGVLRTIGSASKYSQRDAPRRCTNLAAGAAKLGVSRVYKGGDTGAVTGCTAGKCRLR